MVKVENFNGPITDLAVAEWLSTCEDIFDGWKDDNQTTLTNTSKIHAAGNAISKDGPTKELRSWWTRERLDLEQMTWDDFRDAIKYEALGPDWRLRALKNFYTNSQGSLALKDYFTALNNSRFIVSRSNGLPKIDEFVFKCHLLFNASPSLVDQVIKNNINDTTIINGTVKEIKNELRKYVDTATTASSISNEATPTASLAAGTRWILSDVRGLGGNYGTAFTDTVSKAFSNLPPSSNLPHLNQITVYTNGDASIPIIQGIVTKFATGQVNTNPSPIYNQKSTYAMNLESGEYINQIQTSIRGDAWGICFIEIKTSRNQILVAGATVNSTSPLETFTAPSGWRIVGFNGEGNYSYFGRYVIPKLGVIYAPVV